MTGMGNMSKRLVMNVSSDGKKGSSPYIEYDRPHWHEVRPTCWTCVGFELSLDQPKERLLLLNEEYIKCYQSSSLCLHMFSATLLINWQGYYPCFRKPPWQPPRTYVPTWLGLGTSPLPKCNEGSRS